VSASRAIIIAALAVLSMLVIGCGPERVREDRTHGLTLEMSWSGEERSRSSYFSVDAAGEFGSSGGIRARDRAIDFRTRLDDAEVARFVELVEATAFASRAREAGESGDRSEVSVIRRGARSRFTVLGPDPAVDALRVFLREISLRQFRDVIEAQPQAGERRR
jgi:hypothetical protein